MTSFHRLFTSDLGFRGRCLRVLDRLAARFLSSDSNVYRYVSFFYKDYMAHCPLEAPVGTDESNTIWVCWLQGIDQAPRVVRKCYETLTTLHRDRKIVLITADNMMVYVSFPPHILEKLEKGLITRTHFSTLLRSALLYNHGGVWIDSTMLLTAPIPDYVFESPIFAFKFYCPTHQQASNQFMRAHRGDPVIGRTLFGLYEYWRRNDTFLHYNIYHFFFAVSTVCTEENRREWAALPKHYSEINHALQRDLFEPFTEQRWNYLKSLTFVHKLTYKSITDEKLSRPGTFYRHLIGDTL